MPASKFYIERLLLLMLVYALVWPLSLSAQDSLRDGHSIDIAVVDFEVDNLGNIYVVNQNGRIKKLSPQFDSMAVYNQVRQFGELFGMDASNPLKLLLFYRDYATVVVLDRFLNDRATIDLRRSGILQPAAIAQSFDNNIWVWDDLDSRLLKVSDAGDILLSSPDLRITFDEPPQPQTLHDYNRNVYAYDSLRGLLVWDYYGAYKSLLPYKGWQHIHSAGKGIVGMDDDKLMYYDPLSPLPVILGNAPPEMLGAKKLRLWNDKILLLKTNGHLLSYKLQQRQKTL